MNKHLNTAVKIFKTQYALAKACGVNRCTINYALRKGKTMTPWLAKRIEIATKGKVTAQQLIFGDE